MSAPTLSLNFVLSKLLGHPRATQTIKWIVYGALLINFSIYVSDDFRAYQSSLPAGAPWSQILEKFSTTVDTAAWMGLVLLFEVETYIVADSDRYDVLSRVLTACRLVCYALIGAAAYGYIADAMDYNTASLVPGLTDLCTLAGQEIWLQTNSINFSQITADNCASLSTAAQYYQLSGEVSLMDSATVTHAKTLAWVNVVNAFVWLLVVFLIEVAIRLQQTENYRKRELRLVHRLSTIFYGILIAIAVFWLFTGYALYTWDAVLWIAGFWAIELNLAEWEQDYLKAEPA
ncbi:MAG: hypothetical protein AAF402_17310 [Pseudomonadota bacterium]